MLTTKRPPESPDDHDPISRLVTVLEREGFQPVHEDDEWSGFGEKVWHRSEKVLFAEGETVVIVIEHPDVDETILDQAMRGMRELFRARSRTRQALSVLQTTTVYVCISGSAGMPYHGKLNEFIAVAGGAVILPVVAIPDHNTVIYPDVSAERKFSPIRRRVEYLQYLLGEVREPVEIHRPTVRTFWISVGFAAALVVAAILTAIF
jgi:hypothetical protein